MEIQGLFKKIDYLGKGTISWVRLFMFFCEVYTPSKHFPMYVNTRIMQFKKKQKLDSSKITLASGDLWTKYN